MSTAFQGTAPGIPSSPSTPAPAAPAAGAPGFSAPAFAAPPRGRRVNLRLVAILGVLALPFLYFGYVILDQAMRGGVEDHGNYVKVDLKSLGYFPFDANKDTLQAVPKRFRELDGRRVVLAGEMFAPQASGPKIDHFELVYSIQKCCFGGPPKVQERVFARVPNNGKVPYYAGIARVVGTLHVKDKRDETGAVVSLYEMDVESVEPTS